MSAVMFSFYNLSSLIQLNIGLSDRLNENRSESFAIMFFDFSDVAVADAETKLTPLLRSSDSIVHFDHFFFVVMPYTDRYGAGIVKRIVEDAFGAAIRTSTLCYPANGENALELLEALHADVKKTHGLDLDCLYSAMNQEP